MRVHVEVLRCGICSDQHIGATTDGPGTDTTLQLENALKVYCKYHQTNLDKHHFDRLFTFPDARLGTWLTTHTHSNCCRSLHRAGALAAAQVAAKPSGAIQKVSKPWLQQFCAHLCCAAADHALHLNCTSGTSAHPCQWHQYDQGPPFPMLLPRLCGIPNRVESRGKHPYLLLQLALQAVVLPSCCSPRRACYCTPAHNRHPNIAQNMMWLLLLLLLLLLLPLLIVWEAKRGGDHRRRRHKGCYS